MHPIPREQWASFCAEVSQALQGHRATVELMAPGDDAELLAADMPFDALRLEGDGDAARILAIAGGRAIYEVAIPERMSHGEADAILIEGAGGLAIRITFAPAGQGQPRRHAPTRERAVGDEGR